MYKEKLLQDLEYQFVCDFIKLRKESNLTQQDLADMSGVVREKIARIENQMNSPQLNSLIKLLEPLGYTITITKIKEEKDEQNNRI